MAAAKKGSKWPAIVIVGGIALAGGYLYYRHQQQQKQAAAGTASSSATQGLTAVPQQMPSPMEYPNQFSGTPTIQNYVTQPTTVQSSTTTVVLPPMTHFHFKQHNHMPDHPPTSPHMGGRH